MKYIHIPFLNVVYDLIFKKKWYMAKVLNRAVIVARYASTLYAAFNESHYEQILCRKYNYLSINIKSLYADQTESCTCINCYLLIVI